ncbi:MAG: hypothetical protein ACK5YQ_06235 [Betaproteobacteria bacterium]|jgi:hypothetical protein
MSLAASVGLIESVAASDYDERRQDRREAIVAGAVRSKYVNDRVEERYRECMRGSRYDQDCDRQRWQGEQEAKKKGRRAAIIVGSH